MHHHYWTWSIVGLGLMVGACATEPTEIASPIAPSPAPSVFTSPTPTNSMAVRPNQPIAVPLIPPTGVTERLPQVSVGRSDPFTPVADAPTVSVAPVAAAPAPLTAALPTNPAPLPQPVIVPATPSLPTLAPAPPALPVAVATPVAPMQSDIQVSGVVQIGSKLSAIVELPGQTSRYVSVGDRLGNGALVRRIEMAGQPRVIFEQDGREIVRPVL